MKNYRLPEFRPVTQGELRKIWAEHPDMRRLVLEIERNRRVLAEIDRLYQSTQQAWRENGGGHLVALHMFKVLMSEERTRGSDG
ncbi:hypothetical protein [Ectopseudomonas guguanensis]|uniref:hypothetical protein n=1 Tax=Ectopseudomonas guguanensis TaxID=1198456 RepID=UPI0028A9EDB7|nr:hypothetical protein [Pseudomonas guguanensis]